MAHTVVLHRTRMKAWLVSSGPLSACTARGGNTAARSSGRVTHSPPAVVDRDVHAFVADVVGHGQALQASAVGHAVADEIHAPTLHTSLTVLASELQGHVPTPGRPSCVCARPGWPRCRTGKRKRWPLGCLAWLSAARRVVPTACSSACCEQNQVRHRQGPPPRSAGAGPAYAECADTKACRWTHALRAIY